MQSIKPGLIRFLLVLITVIPTASGFTQNLTSSPWSRYGLGEWQPATFSQSFGMAGTGIAINDPAYINIQNPASYGWLDLTLFDTGLRGVSALQQSDSVSQWRNSTSFSHFAFAFPVTRWWGLSLGLAPFAGTGYSVTENFIHPAIGNVVLQYDGSGGVNRAWIGNGFRIKNKVSVGFNAYYLFGTTAYDRRAVFSNPNTFNTRVREEITINDFTFDAGLQLKSKLSESWDFTAGAVIEAGRAVSADQYRLAYTYTANSGIETRKDTISFINGEEGTITLPQSLGGGISFTSDRWTLTAEGKTTSWSDLITFGSSDSLRDNFQAAFGAQFIPDKFAVNSFFRSVRYRAGFRYTSSRFPESAGTMDEAGISFGIGVPLRKSLSSLNAGVELSQRGSTDPGFIKERFIRFNFTVSINDKWFIKRKYN